MQVSRRTDAGLRYWFAFLAVAAAICMAFGLLGVVSGAAIAAPDDSKSTAATVTSSSSTAAAADASESTGAADAADAAEPAKKDEADPAAGIPLGDDYFYASNNLVLTGANVKANLFASGSTVELKQATVGADSFVGAETINISEMAAKNNLFVAGNNITVSGTTANTLFAAGNNLDIAADATDAYLAGRTVFLKGTFEGDVHVAGDSVVVDPYIVINGTLYVEAQSEPTIATTAKIGGYEYTQVEGTGTDITSGFASIGSAAWVHDLLMNLLGILLVGIIMLLFLRTETVDSMGLLVKDRPVAILVTGLLSLILLPILALGFFLTSVGWPIGTVIVMFCVCITVLAVTYTAIALGRAAFGRINKWISSIIFLAIFGLLMSLPVVDFIVAVLCLVFSVGSAVQGWWVWRRGKDLHHGSDDGESMEFTVPRGSHYAGEDAGMPTSRPLVPSNVQQTATPNPPFEVQN